MNSGDGLPQGWANAKIADLVELKNGYAFKPSDWQEEGLPIVRIQNLNNPEAAFNHYPGRLPDRFRIKNGDLLFAWSGTPGTSFGAHIWRGEDAWLNQHIFRVDFNSTFLDERFLQLAINYNLDDYIFQAHGGAGLAHITKGKFESSELLIAPLNEQRRIVAKIDELFSDLDAGVAALEQAKAKLKRYRAAVLKAAVEGKLTEEWRAKQVEAASRRFSDEASSPFDEAARCRFYTAAAASERIAPTRQDAASTGDAASTVGYFDPKEPVANLLGNLPHWRQEGVTYFVTFRLADSIPQEKMQLWQREREEWLKRNPEPHTKVQRQEYYCLFVERFHKWLDAGHGQCVLALPPIRKIVADALPFFENARYLLREWVVMPNHVHAIVTVLPGYELSDVLHSWRSYTAKLINRQLGRTGTLWQKEPFDHIVRGPQQLERIERYIHDNPCGLAPDRYTLHCLHQAEVEAASRRDVEAASRRFSDKACSRFDEAARCRFYTSAAASERIAPTRRDAVSTYEPASKLLERILNERRRKWEEEQLAAYEKAGKKPPANWKEKYKEPAGVDATNLPPLPEGWCWAKLDQLLVYLRNGYFQSPSGAETGTPILRINAVRPMNVDFSEVRFLDTIDGNVDDYFIQNGDLLFTRYNGSVDLLGVAGMVRGCTDKMLHPDKLIRVKLAIDDPLPAFVEVAANVGTSRKHMVGRARTTAGQTGISGTDVREMPIPLPPLDEQAQIVAQVAETSSQIEAGQAAIGHGLQRAARLRQSILKQAFEGKLVPQGQNDEPASVLLERIKAERDRHVCGKKPNHRFLHKK